MVQGIVAHGLLARIRVLHEIVIHGIGAVLIRILSCQLDLILAGESDGIGIALSYCLCSLHIGAGSDLLILLFIFFLVKPRGFLFLILLPDILIGHPVIIVIIRGLCSIELFGHRKILGLQRVIQQTRLALGQEHLAVYRQLRHIHGSHPCLVADETDVVYAILFLRLLQRSRKSRHVIFTLCETHKLCTRLHQRLNDLLAFRIGKRGFREALCIGQGLCKGRP